METGNYLGINLQYKIKENQDRIGHAFLLLKGFLAASNSEFILRDNLFMVMFFKLIKDSERYSVKTFNKYKNPFAMNEKLLISISNYIFNRLYFYNITVI